MRCDVADGKIKSDDFIFQFTHLREVRRYGRNPQVLWLKEFQFTHLREVRQETISANPKGRNFNSRTYVRCDGLAFTYMGNVLVFQFTHLREVRRAFVYLLVDG